MVNLRLAWANKIGYQYSRGQGRIPPRKFSEYEILWELIWGNLNLSEQNRGHKHCIIQFPTSESVWKIKYSDGKYKTHFELIKEGTNTVSMLGSRFGGLPQKNVGIWSTPKENLMLIWVIKQGTPILYRFDRGLRGPSPENWWKRKYSDYLQQIKLGTMMPYQFPKILFKKYEVNARVNLRGI